MTSDTKLNKRLDPRRYLPADEEFECDIPPAALQLADKNLVTLHPRMGFDGFRQSGLAGAALYAATVAVTGPVVRQDTVASVTGTAAMTVRTHLPKIAAVTLAEVDLSKHDGVVRRRLQHLADGGTVRTLPE